MTSCTQTSKDTPATTMVGANLALEYSEKMRFLHAVTGLSRKALLQEALDNLFAAHAEKLSSFSKSPKKRKKFT